MNIVELSKSTPANLFEIRFPIWNGGKRVVGLAKNRLAKGHSPHNEIRILYTRKSDGKRSFPDNYYFDGNLALLFDTMTVKGMELLLVPLDSLQKLERV